MKKKVFIKTFGCKVNFYDENYFAGKLKDEFEIIEEEKEADFYIVNSCTVTGKADSESRRFATRIKKIYPRSVVIYTGCGAEVCEKNYTEKYGIDYIVGNSKKEKVVEIIKGAFEEKIARDNFEKINKVTITGVEHFSSTRAFLKIQEGCDLFCSYCIVPYTRGRSRSLKTDEVLRQMEVLAGNGYKEIVLTGIHIGLFGLNNGENLLMLLKKINKSKIVPRVRLTSFDPHELSSEILYEISNSDIILPHFHLSFQSGSDKILKKMGRRYSVNDLIESVKNISSNIKDPGIGVDIIVGFPGETEEYFNETVKLLTELPVNYIHAFTYSDRPGTPSVGFPGKVSAQVKKERMGKILEIDKEKRVNWAKNSVGKTKKVLLENFYNNSYGGYGEDYLPVKVLSDKTDLHNTVVDVIINSIEGNKGVGTIIRIGRENRI